MMDTLENNKEIARNFIDALANMDRATLGSLVSADFVNETTGSSFISGKRGWDEFAAMVDAMQGMVPNGVTLNVLSVTAEDDRVVCQLEGDGTTAKGEAYQNEYIFFFRIKDGKISYFAEYMDSYLVVKLFGPDAA
jgi:uncharacterized protein